MTPETAAFLSAADEALADAKRILEIDIPRQAARLAYYAQFHAAQAFIFEVAGTTSKTHKGVDKQFHRLTKSDQRLPSGLARELSSAYRSKRSRTTMLLLPRKLLDVMPKLSLSWHKPSSWQSGMSSRGHRG